MANWKRIIAKEWLIFLLCFIGVGLVTFSIFMSIDYHKRGQAYRQHLKEYKEKMPLYERQVEHWVRKNLSNWKPRKTEHGIVSRGFLASLDFLRSYPDIIKAYKKIFSKYDEYSYEELAEQLPNLDYHKDFPQKPRIPKKKEIDFESMLFSRFSLPLFHMDQSL